MAALDVGRSARTIYTTKALIPHLRHQLAQNPATRTNAQSISPGSPLANLVWLHQFEPRHWQQVAHVLMPVDYLVYCLTGQYVTDYCDSSLVFAHSTRVSLAG